MEPLIRSIIGIESTTRRTAMNIKSLGQWQWLVWWAPLWMPFALLILWILYLEIFVDHRIFRMLWHGTL
jgi:hypothetical protein